MDNTNSPIFEVESGWGLESEPDSDVAVPLEELKDQIEFLKVRTETFDTLAVVSALLAAFNITLLIEIPENLFLTLPKLLTHIFCFTTATSIMLNLITVVLSSIIRYYSSLIIGSMYLKRIRNLFFAMINYFMSTLKRFPCTCCNFENILRFNFLIGCIFSMLSFMFYCMIRFWGTIFYFYIFVITIGFFIVNLFIYVVLIRYLVHKSYTKACYLCEVEV